MRDRCPPERTRVRDVLHWATMELRQCLQDAPSGSAETPYLDSLLLLSLATGEPTERLLAALPDEVGEDALRRFVRLLDQRCRGTPVSYLRGTKEFYGREFCVNPAVLVPRPDTELLVESAIGIVDSLATEPGSLHLHDAFTGSGCIALTIAAERPDIMVSGSDVDDSALLVATANRARLLPPATRPSGERVPFWRSDVLDAAPREIRARELPAPKIITANPPYLTDSEYEGLRGRGWPEPEAALRGGADGLDLVRKLALQAVTLLPPLGYLLVEVGSQQRSTGMGILADAGFDDIEVQRDLAGRDRVLVARRPAQRRHGNDD